MKKEIILFALSMLIGNAFSAEFLVKNNRMYINGLLDQNKVEEFKSHLDTSPAVKTIVFQKSLGGTETVAYEFVKIIRDKGLDTEVKGQCHSACAFAFLAGKRRSFEGGFLQMTFLWLHLARTKDNREASRNSGLMALLEELTHNKIEEPVKSLVRSSWQDAAGVIFMSRDYVFFKTYKVIYCDGSQGSDLSKCKELKDIDPFKFGILTEYK